MFVKCSNIDMITKTGCKAHAVACSFVLIEYKNFEDEIQLLKLICTGHCHWQTVCTRLKFKIGCIITTLLTWNRNKIKDFYMRERSGCAFERNIFVGHVNNFQKNKVQCVPEV